MQAKITDTKIVFPNELPDCKSEQLWEQFLIEKPKDVDIQMSRSKCIQEVIDQHRKYNRNIF